MLCHSEAIQSLSLGAYDDVAEEYYNSHKHPTCDNFREGSRALIRHLHDTCGHAGRSVEVGAGKSLLCELASDLKVDLRDILASDVSLEMLRHSFLYAAKGAHLIVCDATRLPLPDESVSFLVSSLGDPYNTQEFWNEVSRVLRPRGSALFTTPSYEWAIRFRADAHAAAEFVIDGRSLYVPSYIYSWADQAGLISASGLSIEAHASFNKSELSDVVSSKLAVFGPKADGPIVLGLSVRKN